MSEQQETEIRRAESAYERALNRLREIKPGNGTSGAEAVYGQAYQQLVALGARPQLKLKYRRA
jgi:hypothetical protein